MTDGAFEKALANNREWAKAKQAEDPTYFEKLASGQKPEFLWIGCADSRAPASTLLGLPPGSIFEQRSVGTMASHPDMNVQSVLEYGVGALGVKQIIVCGHTQCGAVKGALTMPETTQGVVNLWLAGLREVRDAHQDVLEPLDDGEKWQTLAQLNVMKQVQNVCNSAPVQRAWASGQALTVHGVIFVIEHGTLEVVVKAISSKADAADFTSSAAKVKAL